MLKYLHIENIAVIEKSDIEFQNGFNVLSGETGAGKSIVIDALNAVLGERTSKNLIRSGADRALVTAQFSNIGIEAQNKLNDNGYFADDNGEYIIQRILNADGNGNIKINGQPITANVLRSIADSLVNIHGQHSSQSLLNPDTHYLFIDAVAENKQQLKEYEKEFYRYRDINKEINALQMDESEKNNRIDLLKYQINEIESACITPGESEELRKRSEVYRNIDKLLRLIKSAYRCLDGEDGNGGAVDLLNSADALLGGADADTLSNTSERLAALCIDAAAIKDELSAFLDKFDCDPEKIDADEKRLSLLTGLAKKYGGCEESMLLYLEKAKSELNNISFADEKIAELETQLEICSEKLIKAGDRLTESRKKAASVFSEKVCDVLNFLDMPNVKFIVDFNNGRYQKTGCDEVQFLISANLGEEPKPLSKIASGGELSRIMLAIKSVLADRDMIGTLVFDEIDTGISGRAAEKVGIQLKKVAKNRQVLCVTHLAQIAAKADTHFYIEKNVVGERTVTDIQQLDHNGRVYELARIIGGHTTEQNLKSAEEMLNN